MDAAQISPNNPPTKLLGGKSAPKAKAALGAALVNMGAEIGRGVLVFDREWRNPRTLKTDPIRPVAWRPRVQNVRPTSGAGIADPPGGNRRGCKVRDASTNPDIGRVVLARDGLEPPGSIAFVESAAGNRLRFRHRAIHPRLVLRIFFAIRN